MSEDAEKRRKKREYDAQYHADHRDKILARKVQYRVDHREDPSFVEKNREASREHYAANRDDPAFIKRKSERNHEYYLVNREAILEKRRETYRQLIEGIRPRPTKIKVHDSERRKLEANPPPPRRGRPPKKSIQ